MLGCSANFFGAVVTLLCTMDARTDEEKLVLWLMVLNALGGVVMLSVHSDIAHSDGVAMSIPRYPI